MSLNQRTVVHLKGENEPPSSAAAVNVCVAVDHAQDFIRTSQVLSTGEKGFTVERLQVCEHNRYFRFQFVYVMKRILDKLEKKL